MTRPLHTVTRATCRECKGEMIVDVGQNGKGVAYCFGCHRIALIEDGQSRTAGKDDAKPLGKPVATGKVGG